jgi:Tfp pilus assembly protein PilO
MLPSIPALHRIPLKTHLSLAVLALLCMGLAGYSVHMKQTFGLNTAQVDLQSIQSQLKNNNAIEKKDTTAKSFVESLPNSTKSDDVLREMSRLAVEKGIQLDSLKVSPQAATASELGKIQYTIALKTDFYLFKSWLSSLLDRYPALGVQTLSIRAISNDNNRQEINLALQFFVKD